MEITRTQLRRMLDALKLLDASASPYIGLQWTDRGIAFYRTSNLGYVHSTHYDPARKTLVASFAHLEATLRVILADELDLGEDKSGMLRLATRDPEGVSEVWVHTLRINTAWSKLHRPGTVTKEFDPKTFHDINARPFALAVPPVIKAGKLMLMTNTGIIMRSAMPEVPYYPYPRENFVKALFDLDVRQLAQTTEGYWTAKTEEFDLVVAGHGMGDAMFDTYNRLANPIGEVSAPRFQAALEAAIRWAADEVRIEINARTGRIETRNEQNSFGGFSFGPPQNWSSFAITVKAAKNLYDTLRQSVEETVKLSETPKFTRFTRGSWEMNVGAFR